MLVVAYRIVVRKEKIQGLHFIFPFFVAQGRGGGGIISKHRTFIPRSLAISFILLLAMFKKAQLKQWLIL